MIQFFTPIFNNRLSEAEAKQLRNNQRLQEICDRFQNLSQHSQHSFHEYTYKKITPCDVCGQILRGKQLIWPIVKIIFIK